MTLDILTLSMVVLPAAIVVLYALSRKANVKASVKLMGTTFSLEATESAAIKGRDSDDDSL